MHLRASEGPGNERVGGMAGHFPGDTTTRLCRIIENATNNSFPESLQASFLALAQGRAAGIALV